MYDLNRFRRQEPSEKIVAIVCLLSADMSHDLSFFMFWHRYCMRLPPFVPVKLVTLVR